jgi:hypothetical protein
VRYLKVTIETPYDTLVRYTPLDDSAEYSEADLMEIGQDTVNETCPWGIGEGPVDESEVPEGERVE